MIDNDASYHMIRGEIFFLEPGIGKIHRVSSSFSIYLFFFFFPPLLCIILLYVYQ